MSPKLHLTESSPATAPAGSVRFATGVAAGCVFQRPGRSRDNTANLESPIGGGERPGSAVEGRTRFGGAGFTLVEVLIVIAIVGLVAALAVATYRHARVRGAEAAAVAGLRAIGDAQFAFAQACGKGQYAPTLVSLGAPMPTTGRGFLSPDLAMSDPAVISGYTITMAGTLNPDAPRTCLGEPGVPGYYATADPVAVGVTGNRFFGINTERVLFEDLESFTGNMPESGAPGHGTELR